MWRNKFPISREAVNDVGKIVNLIFFFFLAYHMRIVLLPY